MKARSADRATLDSLLRTLSERAGCHAASDSPPVPTGWGVDLPRGVVHEWFAGMVREGAAFPPVLVLAHLARLAADTRTPTRGDWDAGAVVWIGRACFPTTRTLSPPTACGLLARSLFIDPPDDAARLWAIDLAVRSSGISVVIADGRRLDMAASRRLQLAAQARQRSENSDERGSPLVLLARPPNELGELSAAATRWVITPTRPTSASLYPTWTVQLLRCKGLRPDEASRRFVVESDHATGTVNLSPDVCDRSGAAPGTAHGSDLRIA